MSWTNHAIKWYQEVWSKEIAGAWGCGDPETVCRVFISNDDRPHRLYSRRAKPFEKPEGLQEDER